MQPGARDDGEAAATAGPGPAATWALALGLALAGGCAAPDDTLHTSVGEDAWQSFAPIDLQARLSRLDATPAVLAIAHRDQVLAQAQPEIGRVLAVPIDGRPCEVVIERQYAYDDSSAPAHIKRPTSRDLRSRTFRGLDLLLRCSDGPVPGSAASLRGSHPKRAVVPAVPALALGAVAGWFARSDRAGGERIGTSILFLVLAVVAAVGLGWSLLDGGYKIGGAVLGVTFAIGGLTGGRLWHRGKPHVSLAWLGGLVAGAAPVVLLSPAWGYLGPIAAMACAVLGAAVASVIAVLVKPLVGS